MIKIILSIVILFFTYSNCFASSNIHGFIGLDSSIILKQDKSNVTTSNHDATSLDVLNNVNIGLSYQINKLSVSLSTNALMSRYNQIIISNQAVAFQKQYRHSISAGTETFPKLYIFTSFSRNYNKLIFKNKTSRDNFNSLSVGCGYLIYRNILIYSIIAPNILNNSENNVSALNFGVNVILF